MFAIVIAMLHKEKSIVRWASQSKFSMMNVTLDQLKAFERVVLLGSFHAAALDLHLRSRACRRG